MEQKIHLLDEATINKIAAGEVIESPASVVKELIENAIDAGATEIKIELKEGGKSYIKITDNGRGMTQADARICTERHATSKIKDSSDLFNIKTLGFRGEALSSIAAVSNLKITTKKEERLEGTYLEIEAGKKLSEKKTGAKDGTTIEISHLFFNTPARKKYLKNIQTELSGIIDIVTRYALINQNISFKLAHNEKEIINSPKTKTLKEKILSIYGKEISKSMIKISHEGLIQINGWISKPEITRSDKKSQSIFINHRYIKNQIITKAVYEGYKTLLFHQRNPLFVLDIKINPEQIDVNVHPSKKIVKLSREKEIYEEVRFAVEKTLKENNLIPQVELKETSAKPVTQYSLNKDSQTTLNIKEKDSEYEISTENKIIKENNVAYPQEKETEKQDIKIMQKLSPYKIIGQINKTYILAENHIGLLIIDQHAAQERVFYEKFMKQYKDKGIKTQKLLKPEIIELSPEEYSLAKNNIDLFKKTGFLLEDYGKNTILLRSVPFIFERFDKHLFLNILSEINNLKKKALGQAKEERIIRFSCRKAIKAGDELTKNQMEELLKDLDNTSVPYTCPHGRPTIINISLAELERKFKRVF